MGTSDDVERIAAPVLKDAGLELIDVEFRSGNIVVTVDRAGGIDLDDARVCEQSDLGGHRPRGVGPAGRYELEVSSPGLERRLRRPITSVATSATWSPSGPSPGSKVIGA